MHVPRLQAFIAVLGAAALSLLAAPVRAQLPVGVHGTPGVMKSHGAVSFATMVARDIADRNVYKPPRVIHEPLSIFGRLTPLEPAPLRTEGDGDDEDAAINHGIDAPAPSASFVGLLDDGTSIPPDTQGAVGPTQVVTILNTQFQVQDKTGAIKAGPISLTSFCGSALDSNATPFDPHIVYDPYNSHWIAVIDTADFSNLSDSKLLFAVSKTSDATGVWNFYSIATDTSAATFADYPTLGFNKNWVTVTVNMFSTSAGNFVRSKIFAVNKANLYAGTGTYRGFADTQGFAMYPTVTYDNTIGTQYLVEDWDGSKGQLRISTLTGTPALPVLTTGTSTPASSSLWVDGLNNSQIGPQKGSSHGIENNDARLTNAVYRNGYIWASHTVFLPASNPNHAAAQWWQIAPAGTVKQFGRIDDSSGAVFRAFPSIAVNSSSDVLLGYARFSSTTYPSAYYSFHKNTDAANTMQAEAPLKVGLAPYFKTYSGNRNRWGDYSATVVDPSDDLTFWSLQEYADTAGVLQGSQQDRWGTWWVKVPSFIAFALSGITASPAAIFGGHNGIGAVMMTTGATANTAVQLVSSAPTVIPVSATLTVPKGSISANFKLTTAAVTTDTKVTISAIYNRLRFATNVIVKALALSSLTLNPSTMEGGNPTILSINLTGPAPTGGLKVALTSSNPAEAAVPASVTIPAGVTGISLLVDTDLVAANTTVTFTGKAGAVTTTAKLTIIP